MQIKFYTFLIILCFMTPLMAQTDIPIGTWRTHFSYREGRDLTIANGAVFAASGNGLFTIDRDDFSIRLLSKIDGFSDAGVTATGTDPVSGKVIIGYENGNIDLLDGNNIVNIAVIKNAQLTNSRKYNHIYFSGNLAYLSADFGVVILDIQQNAIRETLTNISKDGTELPVNKAVILEDSIFLACDEGLIGADLNSNLLDFNNWRRYGLAEGLPAVPITSVSILDGQLIAGVDSEGIYIYDANSWMLSSFTTSKEFNSITENSQGLLVSLSDQVFHLTPGLNSSEIISDLIKSPARAYFSEDNEIWVSDRESGLVRVLGGQSENFIPQGPFSSIAVNLDYARGLIFSFPQFMNDSGEPLRNDAGFDLFDKGLWRNFNNSGLENTEPFAPVMDLANVAYGGDGSYYFSSFGYGLMVWDGESRFEIFDENSAGSTLINADPPGRNTYVTSIEYSSGSLWLSNYETDQALHVRVQNGWNTYSFVLNPAGYTLQVLPVFGDAWMRIDPDHGGGIIVYDPENGNELYLTDASGLGNFPSRKVNAIALDKDGQVWVGTDLGIVFYPNPFQVFDGDLDATVPVFENRPLLRDVRITAIEIDGGNRIWIGTDRGVWLFDEGTDEQLYNFTEDNSPLIADQILDIEIHEETGEVFFATSAGIQSFRGTATRGGSSHQNVKIFPNPVRNNFDGLVGISGLVENAIVKITDISGKLIREVRASGGTATWDVSDFSGSRATTGIYLVYSASSNGEETFVGKIAVLE